MPPTPFSLRDQGHDESSSLTSSAIDSDYNWIYANSRHDQTSTITDGGPSPSSADDSGTLSSYCDLSSPGGGPGDFDAHHGEVVIDSNMLLIMHSINARLTNVEAYMDQFKDRLGLLALPPTDTARPTPTAISKPELDIACADLFSRSPEPTHAQLTVLTDRFLERYPGLEHRQVLSLVRKWFRKKREDVTLRLMTTLKRKVPELARHQVRLAAEYQTGVADIRQLMEAARLIPVRERADPKDEALVAFCRAKVVGQLLRQSPKLARTPSLSHH